jgi:hypothetical protein
MNSRVLPTGCRPCGSLRREELSEKPIPGQSALIAEGGVSPFLKIDDEETPKSKSKTFRGDGDGHAQVSAPPAVGPLPARADIDPWAELFKLAPDISQHDEQWIREHAEQKGATPTTLLELAKLNPPAGFTKRGPVAGLKWLVNNFGRKRMSGAVHRTTSEALGIRPRILETAKCTRCSFGHLADGECCDCSTGRDLKRIEDRAANSGNKTTTEEDV